MDDQFSVRKGSIDEHSVEGDTLDMGPFQVAPLLVCMCDWVNSLGRPLTRVNGLQGIGKTTLATRYAEAHPLTLLLDMDAVRCSMGQWDTHEESKALARSLAVEMANAHLRSGQSSSHSLSPGSGSSKSSMA